VPEAEHERARQFYLEFLGLQEIQRPAGFVRNGTWMRAGNFEVHIGLEDGVQRTTRAHIAYEVDAIEPWRAKVIQAAMQITEQPKIPGYDRFHFRDPFGNNTELIQRV
jgi:catechol 2,3-dioxygenase-like lactoylglutathione lyase family enzyme